MQVNVRFARYVTSEIRDWWYSAPRWSRTFLNILSTFVESVEHIRIALLDDCGVRPLGL